MLGAIRIRYNNRNTMNEKTDTYYMKILLVSNSNMHPTASDNNVQKQESQ